MAGNNGGPWGGGGNDGGDDDDRRRPNGDGNRNGGQRPPNDPQIPEFDEIINKTKDQLRVLMGGGNDRGRVGGGGGGGAGGPQVSRGMIGLGVLGAVVLWAASSFYTVRPEEKSVELFLGECMEPCIGDSGLNFAPWPLVTYEIVQVTREQVINIGEDPVPQELSDNPSVLRMLEGDIGLMLTGDENIVDIDFQVVWNITRPDQFLFNLAEPEETIAAVSESVMREIIAQSQLANLNQDRDSIEQRMQELTQETLDSYDSGVNIVRINLGAADPPATQVLTTDIDGVEEKTSPLAAYRDVQDAEQERIQLQNQADAYANRETAGARGNAAQILEDAEGYRARVVNEAEGEAARFVSVLEEYQKAPDVTRQRLYLEMVEDVFSSGNIILLDETGGEGGGGVVPYLPLDQLRSPSTGGSN
ncbi:FtsH protease activity modulator HflK [Octadecabacter sp. CECT 8868]|uniref:FtsH protease activity modulator HflK n=1 Tax=Octadecabacter algicola TaxID=2909342 RepID=UPI001F2560F8|nr:FtsH protease activity modulator HflK [Octadecabacter algicola]MCF2904415.1 FtsH protease activity modulator HflK [Octadecabacter algicola]